MIIENLFDEILIEPVKQGCNELLIASGYATSAMAFHHLNALREAGFNDVRVNLIIGMSPVDGISLSNHKGFQQIVKDDFNDKFQCSYRFKSPPFHTKLYIWKKNNELYKSFLGSANYTQTAFNTRKQKEALTNCSNESALDYFNELISDSIYCTHPDSENLLQIYNDRYYRRRARELTETQSDNVAEVSHTGLSLLETITVPLLDKFGKIQDRGGLNWGQRPGREPNQAYIQLRPNVYKSNFFPIISTHFTIFTDDHKSLICTRAQKNVMGTAIETPHNNSLLGEYFRRRLGLPNGAFVNEKDLSNYGRTDVTFHKIDDENYYMDFSV